MTSNATMELNTRERPVYITTGGITLKARLTVPDGAQGVAVLAQGDRRGAHPLEHRIMSRVLNGAGLATLLLDLLTEEERELDSELDRVWFDTRLLARRFVGATDWLKGDRETGRLGIGYFGSGGAAAAALIAAAECPGYVFANVLNAAQAQLAASAVPRLKVPTLFIITRGDDLLMACNREAFCICPVDKKLVLLPEEVNSSGKRDAVEEVCRLTLEWFARHLGKAHHK